jgi:predicted MFS family arabinose efflux permease
VAAAMIGCFSGFGNYFRFAAADIVEMTLKSKAISYVMAGGVVAAFIGPNIANWSQHIFPAEPYAGGFLFLMTFFALMFMALLVTQLPSAVLASVELYKRPLKEIAMQPKFIVAVVCAMLGYSIMTFVMTATPLAMKHHSYGLKDISFVIQWHVLAMFLPSFFTGQLLDRFGVTKILFIGALFAAVCVALNLFGHTLWHFWVALIFLGVSWNFLFVGGTRLLTETYSEVEKAKAQACNDFLVFTLVSIASLSAGFLHHAVGWQPINFGVIPFIVIILLSLFWLRRVGDSPSSQESLRS